MNRRGLAIDVHVLAASPGPVRQLLQTLAKTHLRLFDQFGASLVDRALAVLGDQRQHAILGHVVARHHRTQVEHHHLGRANHVEQRVDDVRGHLPTVDDLDARRRKPLREDVGRLGTEAARVHRANVIHVHETGAPCHELAVGMDGRNQVDVRGVQRRGVGIVQEKDVSFVDASLEAPDD
ncbi:hypothetical protein D3C71_1285670 [compost metagenome]